MKILSSPPYLIFGLFPYQLYQIVHVDSMPEMFALQQIFKILKFSANCSLIQELSLELHGEFYSITILLLLT